MEGIDEEMNLLTREKHLHPLYWTRLSYITASGPLPIRSKTC
jgi:hypothetical protein